MVPLISSLILVFIFGQPVTYGFVEVEKVVFDGVYKSDKCNATVSCHIRTNSTQTDIYWDVVGAPGNSKDLSKLPGFTVDKGEPIEAGHLKQTIKIQKCYKKLILTCRSKDSSKSITLLSADNKPTNKPGKKWALSPGAIVGIIIGILAIVVGIIGCIILIKKRRNGFEQL